MFIQPWTATNLFKTEIFTKNFKKKLKKNTPILSIYINNEVVLRSGFPLFVENNTIYPKNYTFFLEAPWDGYIELIITIENREYFISKGGFLEKGNTITFYYTKPIMAIT